jgi:AraC family transcriptional regulator
VHPRLVAARDRRRRALASVRDLTGGPAVWALLRLLDEMRRHRRDDLESGEPIAEILDALLGEESAPASRPRWLADVERELSEGFRDPVSLRALAERAGVHPVHASRVFRRENGCTMRTFLQRQRVLNACRAILDGQRGLAAIAAESGFCDQAHMTHVFRQVTGMTPTAYRRSRG